MVYLINWLLSVHYTGNMLGNVTKGTCIYSTDTRQRDRDMTSILSPLHKITFIHSGHGT
jgi:hypothetical protein